MGTRTSLQFSGDSSRDEDIAIADECAEKGRKRWIERVAGRKSYAEDIGRRMSEEALHHV
jgi:hypothetical protein